MSTIRDTENYVRKAVRDLVAFQYNKSPDSLKDKIPLEQIIKLNGNENQYGPSPKVYQALAEYRKYHIYPDATQVELRKSLAEYAGTTPDRIVATGGGDQLLNVIVRMFIDPGDEIITCVPSYEVYRLYGQIAGAKVVEVPRGDNFDIKPDLVLKAITDKTKLIFLCNPNNPTGTTIPQEDIIGIVNSGVPVVVDEAYYEFSGLTMLPYIEKYPNMMLARTFSKWAAMAGFRLGYGIMHPNMAVQMYKIKPPFGVGVPALVAFKASLEDKDYLLRTVQKIVDERERISKELPGIGPFKPYPSKGNFIFFAVLVGDAGQIVGEMEERGIMIRHFNTPLLKHGIRLSIGRPEQNDRVLTTLKEIAGK